jgi:hypothetical protein
MIIRFLVLSVFSTSLSLSQGFLHEFAVLHGDSIGDQFNVICNSGDFNGDGYSDIAIGAPGGAYVKVYFGGPNFDTIPACVLRSDQALSRFGGTLTVGDINGDGYDDLIVGAMYYCEGGVLTGIYQSGKVFIYYGGKHFSTSPSKTIAGRSSYDEIGGSLAFVGDINGDHYGDLLVSATKPTNGGIGDLWIYEGGPGFDGVAACHLQGDSLGDMFGFSITALGDLNKDGYTDFLIGAPEGLKPGPGYGKGKAYVFWGGSNVSLLDRTVVYGDTSSVSFGRYSSALGDIDGDGYLEVGILSSGECRIYTVKQTQLVLRDSMVIERYQGSMQSISAGFDFNKDGFQDFLVGIGDRNTQYSGSLLVYGGETNISLGSPLLRIDGPFPFYHYASSLGIFRHLSDSLKAIVAVGEIGTDGTAPYKGGRVVLYSTDVLDGVRQTDHTIPLGYELRQNYPNPFNPSTLISFDLPQPSVVSLKVFDCLGREVSTLIHNQMPVGRHRVRFDGSEFVSGMYFYRIEAEKFNSTKKMLLLK